MRRRVQLLLLLLCNLMGLSVIADESRPTAFKSRRQQDDDEKLSFKK